MDVFFFSLFGYFYDDFFFEKQPPMSISSEKEREKCQRNKKMENSAKFYSKNMNKRIGNLQGSYKL